MVFLLLARFFLGDKEFGAVALVNSVLAFSQVIARLGITTALIQRTEITDDHKNVVFWTSATLSLALSAVFVIIAPQIGNWLNEPLIAHLMFALAPGMVLTLLAATHEALLTKELSFKTLAIRSLLASLVGGFFALLAAVLGWGVWSLVVLNLVTATVNLVIAWYAHPWRPRFTFNTSSFKELFSTGIRVTGIGFVVYVYRHIDNLVLGSLVGISQLGLYYFGKRLLTAILELLGQSVNAVALPSFSLLGEDYDRVQRGLIRLSSIVAAIAFPALVGLATLADSVVLTLFGTKWAAASPILQWLCIGGIPQALTYFASPLLIALNQARAAFKATLVATLAMLSGSIIGAFFGAEGVAIGFTIANAFMFIYYGRIVLKITGLPAKQYLLSIMPPFASAFIMATLVTITDVFIPAFGMGEASTLFISILIGVISYTITLRIVDPSLYRFFVDTGTAFIRKH